MLITCYYCNRENDEPLWIGHINYDGVGICVLCLRDAVYAYQLCKQIVIEARRNLTQVEGEGI
jgi:hypothetical protein